MGTKEKDVQCQYWPGGLKSGSVTVRVSWEGPGAFHFKIWVGGGDELSSEGRNSPMTAEGNSLKKVVLHLRFRLLRFVKTPFDTKRVGEAGGSDWVFYSLQKSIQNKSNFFQSGSYFLH